MYKHLRFYRITVWCDEIKEPWRMDVTLLPAVAERYWGRRMATIDVSQDNGLPKRML